MTPGLGLHFDSAIYDPSMNRCICQYLRLNLLLCIKNSWHHHGARPIYLYTVRTNSHVRLLRVGAAGVAVPDWLERLIRSGATTGEPFLQKCLLPPSELDSNPCDYLQLTY